MSAKTPLINPGSTLPTRTLPVLCALLISIFIYSCDPGVPPPPLEQDGILYDVAGTQGLRGNDGDDGLAIESLLYLPVAITVAPGGEILVADLNNNRVRRISTDGIIHGFIGSGFQGDDTSGPGPVVDLNHPADIAIGPYSNYFVADFENNKVKVFDAVTLECSVRVGPGDRGYRGGGDPPIYSSLVFDPSGSMLVVDQGNSRILKVDAQTDTITTFAGGTRGYADGIGEAAQFSLPGCEGYWCGRSGIEISLNGEDIYLTDTENHVIRKINIATRVVTTIAGTPTNPGWEGDGGPALSALLNYPTDLDVANNGDIYVADTHNHVIRKISASGIITTVAGNGIPGSSPNGTPAVEAKLNGPEGLAFDDATNTLYICDTYNHQIKKIINP